MGESVARSYYNPGQGTRTALGLAAGFCVMVKDVPPTSL